MACEDGVLQLICTSHSAHQISSALAYLVTVLEACADFWGPPPWQR